MTTEVFPLLCVLLVLLLIAGVILDDWKQGKLTKQQLVGDRQKRVPLGEMAMTRHLGTEVLNAFGLPSDRCTGLRIDLQAGEPVKVTATYHIGIDQGRKAIQLVRESSLRAVPDDLPRGASNL